MGRLLLIILLVTAGLSEARGNRGVRKSARTATKPTRAKPKPRVQRKPGRLNRLRAATKAAVKRYRLAGRELARERERVRTIINDPAVRKELRDSGRRILLRRENWETVDSEDDYYRSHEASLYLTAFGLVSYGPYFSGVPKPVSANRLLTAWAMSASDVDRIVGDWMHSRNEPRLALARAKRIDPNATLESHGPRTVVKVGGTHFVAFLRRGSSSDADVVLHKEVARRALEADIDGNPPTVPSGYRAEAALAVEAAQKHMDDPAWRLLKVERTEGVYWVAKSAGFSWDGGVSSVMQARRVVVPKGSTSPSEALISPAIVLQFKKGEWVR